MTNERKEELYNNMLNHISELVSDSDLKDTLHCLGFTDEEIIEEGFELEFVKTCSHCGKAFDQDPDDTVYYKGKPICDHCYQDYYGYCEVCEELHPYEEMIFADGNYCEKCIDTLLTQNKEMKAKLKKLKGEQK